VQAAAPAQVRTEVESGYSLPRRIPLLLVRPAPNGVVPHGAPHSPQGKALRQGQLTPPPAYATSSDATAGPAAATARADAPLAAPSGRWWRLLLARRGDRYVSLDSGLCAGNNSCCFLGFFQGLFLGQRFCRLYTRRRLSSVACLLPRCRDRLSCSFRPQRREHLWVELRQRWHTNPGLVIRFRVGMVIVVGIPVIIAIAIVAASPSFAVIVAVNASAALFY